MRTARRPWNRRPLVAAVFAAVVLPFLVVPAARAEEDAVSGDVVVGELVQAWPEHLDPHEAAAEGSEGPLSWIGTGEDAVRVDTEDVEGVPVGTTVEVVLGDEVPDSATAEGVEPAFEALDVAVVEAAPDSAPLAPATAVTNEVLIVRVTPAGAVQDSTSITALVDAVNDPVQKFWDEQSNGAVNVYATGWANWVPTAAPCSEASNMWAQAASAVGFQAGPGKHLMLYVPTAANLAGCWDGLAQVKSAPNAGGLLYVRHVSPSIIAHELGHNFGLGHSSALQCQGSTDSGTCRTDSYGDWYDVMGVSWGQMGSLNPPQAARLGFLPAGQQTSFTAETGAVGSTLTLLPTGGRSGLRAIRFVDQGGAVYWLEYRAAVARDSWLGTSANYQDLQAGVLLRRASTGSDTSLLLDGTPLSTPSLWDTEMQVALPIDQEVRFGAAGFRVTVRSLSTGGATVAVGNLAPPMGGDASCVDRATVPSSGIALSAVGGSLHAFGTGTDRQVWYRPVGRGTPGWSSLGGVSLYGPAAVTAGTTSHVFVVGGDGALYMRADNGYGWGPWTNLGGYLTATPAAASLGAGHLRVFGRGGDNELWTREFNGSGWSAWTYLGGVLTSPPAATAYPGFGQVEVSVRGTDGLVYTMGLGRGDGFRGYGQRRHSACSTLAVPSVSSAAFASGRVYLDADGQAAMASATIGSHVTYGGRFLSNPDVESVGGWSVLAGTGGDRQMWVYDSRPGGLGGWVSIGGQFL